ncbi:hypothetical protein L7D48_06700 [Streptomyces sp. S1A]|uniref:hypothetical protein n=1 Tax=Streptomyces sp. ICN903 TaxID=2964654 RepID=UPI001EDC7BE7|nr:hypothetical protein [Streptomyces sp. ICN903]MCG3040260.1 hypothetical protein [Streptomyces sp. ICN903]
MTPRFDLTVAVRADGERVLVVQPALTDDQPQEVKDALAVRRVANTTGVCPGCGARMELPNRAERRKAAKAWRVLHARMEHEDDCPAVAV